MCGRRCFLVTIILLAGLALAACQSPSSEPIVTPSEIGLANPASVHCQEQGGALEMRQDEGGGVYGVCIFSDGSECEEWAYFNGNCRPGQEQGAETNRLNLVEAAELRQTVALDILALNLEPADEPYSHLLTIADEAALVEIVDALDRPMGPGPRLACIPLYRLNFRLADGRTIELEYSCGEGQGTFLRGGAPLAEGQDYLPPGAFNDLMLAHIQSTWAQSINPVVEHGLDRAVALEILESVVSENESGEPGITTAQIVSRLKTDDPAQIRPLLATLDGDFTFTRPLRCPAQYILQFTLDDGSMESLGYYCRDGAPTLLKGDQPLWHGRAITPPSGFQDHLDTLLSSD